jgi:uncharacterized protein (TIGR00266 family)
MKYDIVGSNMQHLALTMADGEKIYADSGTLVSKTENIVMTPRLAGGIISALERKATGTTALLTEFASKGGEGTVAVAGIFPGKIFQITLGAGERFTSERHAFLAADASVKYDVHVLRISTALLAHSGWYLLEFVGPGNVFIHVSGDIIEHDITPGNSIEVEPEHVAGFDSQLSYKVRFVDNIRTAMFGGVGLFLAKFEGNGRLITHAVSRHKLSADIYTTAIDDLKK